MTYNEIERAFSTTEELGFEPNEGNDAGAILLCFTNPSLAYVAYTELIYNKGDDEVLIKIKEQNNRINLKIIVEAQGVEMNIRKRNFNKEKFKAFKEVNGGGPALILLIGHLPASENHFVTQQGASHLVVKWEFED